MSTERKPSFFEVQGLISTLFLGLLAQTVIRMPKGMYADRLRGHRLANETKKIWPRYDREENALYIESSTKSLIEVNFEDFEVIDIVEKGTRVIKRKDPRIDTFVSRGQTVTLPNGVEVSNIQE